jgi:hypothetical protein
MKEVELYWKSIWEEKVQHNEKADWIKREEKEEIDSMNWIPIKTAETTSFLSKTHNWKSPGMAKGISSYPQLYHKIHQHNNRRT